MNLCHVWCGVVWCGVVWCGVVWCGVVWCGVEWSGVLCCAVLCCAVLCCAVVWCGVVWCGVVWCGVVWCGASNTDVGYISLFPQVMMRNNETTIGLLVSRLVKLKLKQKENNDLKITNYSIPLLCV